MLSQSRDGSVLLWDIETGHTKYALKTGSVNFCRLAIPTFNLEVIDGFAHCTPLFASANGDKDSLSLWDMRCCKEVQRLRLMQPSGLCMAVAFHKIHSCPLLLSAFESGVLTAWDLRKMQSCITPEDITGSSGTNNTNDVKSPKPFQFHPNNFGPTEAESQARPARPVFSLDSGWKEPMLAFACTDHGEGIIGGAHEEMQKISIEPIDVDDDSNSDEDLKVTNSVEARVTKNITMPKPGVNSIAIRQDRKIFACAGWDFRIRIFSLKKATPLAILKCHTASVQQLAFSRVDNLLVAGGQDGQVSLWNLY